MFGYYGYGYGLDPMYFVCLILVFVSLWASANVNSAYKKYSDMRNARGLTAAEVTRMILDRNGQRDVRIERVSGHLSDHYDPRTKVVRLSDSVYDSTSVSAIGVAAHEAGHAAQHAEGYAMMKLRSALVPVTNFGSRFGILIALAGLIFNSDNLAIIGLVLYFAVVLFALVTLPVEFNASSRALRVLDSQGILGSMENAAAKKVLRAAAMTYVVSALAAIAQFLRFFLMIFGSRRRD